MNCNYQHNHAAIYNKSIAEAILISQRLNFKGYEYFSIQSLHSNIKYHVRDLNVPGILVLANYKTKCGQGSYINDQES